MKNYCILNDVHENFTFLHFNKWRNNIYHYFFIHKRKLGNSELEKSSIFFSVNYVTKLLDDVNRKLIYINILAIYKYTSIRINVVIIKSIIIKLKLLLLSKENIVMFCT